MKSEAEIFTNTVDVSAGISRRPPLLFRVLPSLNVRGVQRDLAIVAAWSLVAAVIARAANLFALILCARILAPEQFGRVTIIQSTVGMFGPIAALGLSMTATKFLAECRDTDKKRAGRIMALSMSVALVTGLFMTGVLILSAPQLAARGLARPDLGAQLIQASGLLVLGVIESVQIGALTGLEAFSKMARLSAWSGVLSIPIIALLTLAYGATGAIAGLTIALLLSCVLNGATLRAECRRQGIPWVFSGCFSERQILLRFGLPSYLSSIVVAPVTWLSSALLVKQAAGLSEVGLFSAADRFRYLLIFVPLAVSRIAVPSLSRFRSARDHHNYRKAFNWNVGFGLLATLPFAVACIVLSPQLMALFGPSFSRGWPVLAILAFSSVPTVLNTQLGAALLSDGRAWTRTGVDTLLAILFLATAWMAIPRWNAAGLAAAFAVAYSATSLFLWICLEKGRSHD